jgi:hypothetical protein
MADITLGSIVKNVGSGFINKTWNRLKGSGAGVNSQIVNVRAKWSGRTDATDWRVKLTLPAGSALSKTFFPEAGPDDRLAPLRDIGGFFFPLTPSMIIQHSANYNALSQTHSNYPFQAYQNSQVDQMNIIGEFPVQNQQDAKYWVATVNFLRTVTKMFFGKEQAFKGNPPPIMHLSGYGDHMFNKVPVVVQSFNVELRSGVDYISTKQNAVYKKDLSNPNDMKNADVDQTWAPTLSTISVGVIPVYSRDSIKSFSLTDFASGKLAGKGEGEIGFI